MSKPCPRCGFTNPRSTEANALSHVWYLMIADFMNLSALQAKAYCKLRMGVPILRAESVEFCQKYDRLLKPLPYEIKLELMEWFPVSSLMTRGQMNRYMGDVQHHFAEQGLVLESENEEVL